MFVFVCRVVSGVVFRFIMMCVFCLLVSFVVLRMPFLLLAEILRAFVGLGMDSIGFTIFHWFVIVFFLFRVFLVCGRFAVVVNLFAKQTSRILLKYACSVCGVCVCSLCVFVRFLCAYAHVKLPPVIPCSGMLSI